MAMRLNSFPEEWASPEGFLGSPESAVRPAVFGNDKNLLVQFMRWKYIDEPHFERTHEKRFIEADFVKIQRIGDKFSVYFQPVRPKDIRRFPAQYKAFKEGKNEYQGIRLEEWDFHLPAADMYALKALDIHYVHQLAAMEDSQVAVLGINGPTIVARARVDTAELATKEGATKLQLELEAARKEIREIREEQMQFMAMMRAKTDEKEKEERWQGRLLTIEQEDVIREKRGRGRPRKEEVLSGDS